MKEGGAGFEITRNQNNSRTEPGAGRNYLDGAERASIRKMDLYECLKSFPLIVG